VVTETANYRPQQKKSEATYLDPLLELEGADDWWEATPAAFKSIGKKVQNGAWYNLVRERPATDAGSVPRWQASRAVDLVAQ
jgi:hypothetical protein